MLNLDKSGVKIRLVKEERLLISDINPSLASLFGAQLRAGRVSQWVASIEA